MVVNAARMGLRAMGAGMWMLQQSLCYGHLPSSSVPQCRPRTVTHPGKLLKHSSPVLRTKGFHSLRVLFELTFNSLTSTLGKECPCHPGSLRLYHLLCLRPLIHGAAVGVGMEDPGAEEEGLSYRVLLTAFSKQTNRSSASTTVLCKQHVHIP